jgi:anti-sigma-K factor RskA
MSTDDPRELIGAYVLDACTPEEAAEVRAHMTASAEFRAEVESYEPVYDALLEAPEPDVTPGPGLKRSIMAQVQAEASLFAAAGPSERAAIVREGGAAADPLPHVRGTGQPAPSARRNAFLEALRHPARATALAAVLVALIVGGIVVGGGGGGGTEERSFAVVPTPQAGNNASGRLVADGDSGTLKLSGFRATAPDREYQVWLQTGKDDPKPTKVLFTVDGKGHGEATIPGLKNVDQVLVTAEPKGGSPAPTTEPVLHVQI